MQFDFSIPARVNALTAEIRNMRFVNEKSQPLPINPTKPATGREGGACESLKLAG